MKFRYSQFHPFKRRGADVPVVAPVHFGRLFGRSRNLYGTQDGRARKNEPLLDWYLVGTWILVLLFFCKRDQWPWFLLAFHQWSVYIAGRSAWYPLQLNDKFRTLHFGVVQQYYSSSKCALTSASYQLVAAETLTTLLCFFFVLLKSRWTCLWLPKKLAHVGWTRKGEGGVRCSIGKMFGVERMSYISTFKALKPG